jgi:hypothetical protein
LKIFSGATRPFLISAVSSIDIIAMTGRYTILKWRWRRCKIVQKWSCSAEWWSLGLSAHIFCMTPWMPTATFRCHRCLHWILSYASIFPFKKVHVKIISIIFALEI